MAKRCRSFELIMIIYFLITIVYIRLNVCRPFGITLGIRLIKLLNKIAKRCKNFELIMVVCFLITIVYIRLDVCHSFGIWFNFQT